MGLKQESKQEKGFDLGDFLLSLPEKFAYGVLWVIILMADSTAKVAGKVLPNRPQKK